MSEKVSVVVPIYNVEKYLIRCVESIINQSYKNLQVILVDDGSTDSCPQICDEYLEKDKRIEVIHKANGGLSEARNFGIDKATGDYITFVDSDDFINDKFIEYLLKLLNENNADIACCSFQRFSNENEVNRTENKIRVEQFNGIEAIENLCYQKEIKNSACAKIYRRKLFEDVCYPVGKLYEDLGTTYKLLFKAKKVVWSQKEYYYYFYRPDSIMNYKFSIKNMDRINLSKELLDFVEVNIPEIKDAAIARFFISNIQVLREIPYGENAYIEERNRISKNIKKYRGNVFFNRNVKLINRCIAISTYLPLELVQKLGGVYKRFEK